MDLNRTVTYVGSPAQLLSVDLIPASDRRLARLHVTGELDESTTGELLKAVRQVLDAPVPERVELHMAGLSFVDSAGIRCLLTCRTAVEDAGSRLVLTSPTPQVVRVLEITGLAPLFGLARHAGSDTERRPAAGTGAPRRAQPLHEVLEESISLRETARETRARARAAGDIGLPGTLWPKTAAD